MKIIRTFVLPERLFEVLKDLRRKRDFITTMRRFETDARPAALEVIDPDRENPSRYSDEGFSEIYLTLTKKPSHAQDWSFLSDAADELIVIAGGRRHGEQLEKLTARLFLKDRSKAKALFDVFQKHIAHGSRRGVTSRGTFYRDVYVHDTVVGLELRESIDDESLIYEPAEVTRA